MAWQKAPIAGCPVARTITAGRADLEGQDTRVHGTEPESLGSLVSRARYDWRTGTQAELIRGILQYLTDEGVRRMDWREPVERDREVIEDVPGPTPAAGVVERGASGIGRIGDTLARQPESQQVLGEQQVPEAGICRRLV